MRIAYISYEHPLGISGGGIGTYVGIIAKIMTERNHYVEVFSGTLEKESSKITINNYNLSLIPSKNKEEFRKNVVEYFSNVHDLTPFQIIESPEFGADALHVKKKYPKLPLVVRLHTPSFLINILNNYNRSLKQKLRFIVGGLLRFKLFKPYWKYTKLNDPEFDLFNLAELVTSPSSQLREIIHSKWNGKKPIEIIENPFIITKPYSNKLNSGENIIITFLGKLEKRKGIIDLMKAVPAILRAFPTVTFRFVGSSSPSPIVGKNMEQYIKTKLSIFSASLDFLGFRNSEEIPEIIEQSHICVFPSIWENFPYACLEAMACGRVVVASSSGGMSEIIDNKKNGFLVEPTSPNQIIQAIKYIITNRKSMTIVEQLAFEKIERLYNAQVIGQKTEECYNKVIQK